MFFGGGYGDDQGDWEDEQTGQSGQEKKQVNTTQYYELLEIQKDATTQQIKKAFRKRALKEHPDKGGDPNRFKQLKEAYDTLTDPQKRQLYDEYGQEGVKNGGPPGVGSNIFDFFNQQKQDNKPKKMKPKLVKLDVTLEQVFLGITKEVNVTRYRVCTDCEGKGGSQVQKCTDCKGQGIAVKLVQLGPGMFTKAQVHCQKCGGAGEQIAEEGKCKVCDGKKVKQQQKKLQVHIEPGVPHQHDYIFYGESDELPGIMAGDVYVRIQILKHERFERRGADLHYHIQITLLEAITGITTKIQHLDGKQYTVATAPGQILINKEPKTLKRLGMPFYKDAYSHGNLYFDFKVAFPPRGTINADQQKALRTVFNYDSTNEGLDKKEKALHLQDYAEDLLNPKAAKGNPDQAGQDEQGGHQGGIQCQQQ